MKMMLIDAFRKFHETDESEVSHNNKVKREKRNPNKKSWF